MNPHYSAFIELGRTLVRERGLQWEMPVDEMGVALDGVGWNLTAIAGDVSPPRFYLRDLGPDRKALAIINAGRVEAGVTPLTRGPLTTAWQNLIKSAAAEQLLLRRNTAEHVMLSITRPLRVIATCVDKEPWQLTADDLRLAIRVGTALQPKGQLGDRVIGLVKTVLDAQHICDAGPLYTSLAVPRMKGTTVVKAKHTWSQGELRAHLESRKRQERLPGRRAFWELTRIVMTEKPLTFMDDLRFAVIRTMIVTGMRAGEAALLPVDWERERTYLDAKGRPAGESGGISTSLMVRHFAEKQQEDESDSRLLHEATQPVPDMFRALLTQTLEHVERLTEPLRATLKRQCETGRLLPWYGVNDLVPFTQAYVRLTGNPFWLNIEHKPFIERYRDGFHPDVLREVHRHQTERPGNSPVTLDMAVYQFGKRLLDRMRAGETALRFRQADGKVLGVRDRMVWHSTFLHVGELEDHVRAMSQTKVSDTTPLPLGIGVVQPWELLFIQPKRSLVEERNDGLCDVTRIMSVAPPVASSALRWVTTGTSRHSSKNTDRRTKTEP